MRTPIEKIDSQVSHIDPKNMPAEFHHDPPVSFGSLGVLRIDY